VPTRWRVSCAVLVLSVVACGSKSTAERIAEHDRVRVSWEQTARFAGTEWIDRAVPEAYATRTLERASEELRSEGDALRKDDIPDQDRARLRDSLNAARSLADTLERAIRARDREVAARIVASAPRANTDSLLHDAGLR
jgi:hypothetical protein